MYKNVKALVLREVRYKEADRILTLLTDTDGKLTARARGALRKSSRTAAATQQLTYSELTLFGNKGRWSVNEGTVLELFPALRSDVARLALGCYFAECLEAISVEDQPDGAMMQLGLNSLYALDRELCPAEQVKAAFELRLMCLAGYEPNAAACPVCGRTEMEDPLLSMADGAVFCRACRKGSAAASALCPASLAALRYVISAPARQLLSFRLGEKELTRLSDAAERYLLTCTERGFSTLDYWKKVR